MATSEGPSQNIVSQEQVDAEYNDRVNKYIEAQGITREQAVERAISRYVSDLSNWRDRDVDDGATPDLEQGAHLKLLTEK